jgi:hypothetical protein
MIMQKLNIHKRESRREGEEGVGWGGGGGEGAAIKNYIRSVTAPVTVIQG